MTLTTERLREIAEDGFLEHGDAKLMARELLANREAQPVLYASEETLAYAKEGEKSLVTWSEPMGDAVIPLFTAPPAPAPAPAVPEKFPEHVRSLMNIHADDLFDDADAQEIWNACRAAMLNHVGDTNEKSKSSIAKTRQEIANDFEIGARATKHRFSLDGKSAAPEGGNDHNTR